MPRLLLANEIGEGFGHLLPWKKTLQGLAATSEWIGIACPDAPGLDAIQNGWTGVEWMRAPVAPLTDGQAGSDAMSWPELMVELGYAQASRVLPLLTGWLSLFQKHRVERVLADYAPMALLAAKASKLIVTEAGSGFCVPPALSPMPGYPGQDGKGGPERIAQAEAALIGCWQQALQTAGCDFHPGSLAEVFGGHARHVTSVAQLDPYGARNNVLYLGALPAEDVPRALDEAEAWWTAAGGDVVAYLKLRTPGLKDILEALQRSGRVTLAVIPGIGLDRIGGGSLRVTQRPMDLNARLQSAKLLVTNGGIHGMGQAIGAGVPTLVIPMHPEQALTAVLAAKNGFGSYWMPGRDPLDKLHRLLRPVS